MRINHLLMYQGVAQNRAQEKELRKRTEILLSLMLLAGGQTRGAQS